MYAVDGTEAGRTHVAVAEGEVVGLAKTELESKDAVELIAMTTGDALDSVLDAVELELNITLDDNDDELDEDVELKDELELEITTFAAEMAFKTVESTQDVFGVVYPAKELAKT